MTASEALADRVFLSVKGYVGKAVAGVVEKLQALERRFDALPVPQKGDPGPPGKDVEPEALAAAIDVAVKALPPPPKGDPGKDAAVDYERLGEMVNATVGAAFAALPVPQNGAPGDPGAPGKDAEVDYDKLGDIIVLAVAKEVAKLPAAKDGAPGTAAEVDYARVAEMIKAAVPEVDYAKVDALIGVSVSKAVAAIPAAKDGTPGKDAVLDYGHVNEIIKAAAILAVAELPKPRDGKDADPELLRSEIEREVRVAIAAIPVPKDGEPGKDAEPVDYASLYAEIEQKFAALPKVKDGEQGAPGKDANEDAIVDRVLKALPPPVNGKDADEAAIVAKVMDYVDAHVAAIPKPENGKDADEPAIIARLTAMLEEKVTSIPRPKDGEPGRDAIAAAIVRGIDEGRSYPPNTYASHRGAFMVSERQTSPVGPEGLKAAGWLILSDGVALQDVEQDVADPRSFKFRQVLASGVAIEKSFYVPSVIDRNVWYDGMECFAGDLVTCKGAGWIARRRNKSRPGTVPEDWRLTYKP